MYLIFMSQGLSFLTKAREYEPIMKGLRILCEFQVKFPFFSLK